MSVMIAVPAYGGSIRHECLTSIVGLAWTLGGGSISTLNRSDISVARDVFAAEFLSKEHSHLLFVDADMQFRPPTVLKMLKLDRPIVGCIYRKKAEKIGFAVQGTPRNIDPQTGLCEVKGIGMGLCLIQRRVFTDLIGTGKIGTFKRGLHNFPPGTVRRFFEPLVPSQDADELSEDYSFCHRWRTLCAGTVHAFANEDIGHIGDSNYRGTYVDHLKSKAPEAPAPV